MELPENILYGLSLAQLAFTVWMLVDVHRRGAEGYWFWVILFLQPVGPWAYFFAVRLGDLRGLPDWLAWKRRPALAELRYRAEHMPTLASRLALAERLVEDRQYQEALPYLTAVLKQEPELCPALFALAVCHAEDARPEQAIPLLQQVIARERMWSNYAAWYRLIEVQAALGNGAQALATCRELARLAPTLKHRCLLAEHMLDQGLHDEAGQFLQIALQEHQYAPGFIRRRNRQWASRARQLQKEIAES